MADNLQSPEKSQYEQGGIHEEPQNGSSGQRLMQVLVGGSIILGFGVAVVYAYNKGRQAGESKVPPIIQAQEGPTKVRPENPGGMQVPDQDKEVFTRLAAKKQPARVERLLPPPERPIEKPFTSAATHEKLAEPAYRIGDELPGKDAILALKSPPEIIQKTPANKRPVQSKTKKTRPVKAQEKYATGIYRVQLSSLRSESALRKKWMALKYKHRELLGNLKLTVEPTVLGGGRGTFYRMQVGPLASKKQATALCSKVKERNLGCFVVRR